MRPAEQRLADDPVGTMSQPPRAWLFPLSISLLTLFGVFVVPFFFPPAFTQVMSVSNAAGFNNKVAAVAAALCAVTVFFASLLKRTWPSARDERPLDLRPLPWTAIATIAATVGAGIGLAGWVVHVSHLRYVGDLGYFVNQLQNAVVYHRRLYTEIEFPYGPLLFYPPILLYHALAGWGATLKACYILVLVGHQVMGVLLVGYLANALPMSHRWKWGALGLFSIFTVQPMLGFNYTLFRFALPMAALVFAARQKKPLTTAVLLGLGEILSLSVSPEMGFAFTAGALAYGLVLVRRDGRVWVWSLLAVPTGLALFLLAAGRPYLKMVGLFAGGAFNFIVEPLPHVLLFLLALVWFAPRVLALRWQRQEPDAAMQGACFVFCCALVPVAFGRADPVHVFFDGLGIFLLSFIAVSQLRRWQQIAWGLAIGLVMVHSLSRVYILGQIEIGQAVRRAGREYRTSLPVRTVVALVNQISRGVVERFDSPMFAADPVFDSHALQAIVGMDTVATPVEITLQAEEALKQSGQYRPSFYCFMIAVLDRAAEERKIEEFNQAKWAMLPTGGQYTQVDSQELANFMLGIPLPYRAKRPPYVSGERFIQNLATRWVPVGTVNEYTVYRKRDQDALPAGR